MKRPCREKADGAHARWDTGSSNENRASWKLTLNELYKTYGQVREQELEGHSRFIENAFGAQQYSETWIVVNEMTGHKRAKEGQVSCSIKDAFRVQQYCEAWRVVNGMTGHKSENEDLESVRKRMDP